MSVYLVSRHKGTLDWFEQQGVKIDHHIVHFDPDCIQPGDTVVGILPIQLAAKICAKGGRYLHLQMNVPLEFRGQELSTEQLDEFGAELVCYNVLAC